MFTLFFALDSRLIIFVYSISWPFVQCAFSLSLSGAFAVCSKQIRKQISLCLEWGERRRLLRVKVHRLMIFEAGENQITALEILVVIN